MTVGADDDRQLETARAGASASAGMDVARGLVGAIAGGVVGYWLFLAIASQGFHVFGLTGALVGLGGGALSGRKSILVGIVCGVLGLAVGLYAEWRAFPLIADGSFTYFVTHAHQLMLVSKISIVLDVVFAYWFGLGREGGTWPRRARGA